jgi:hypothetical protein
LIAAQKAIIFGHGHSAEKQVSRVKMVKIKVSAANKLSTFAGNSACTTANSDYFELMKIFDHFQLERCIFFASFP